MVILGAEMSPTPAHRFGLSLCHLANKNVTHKTNVGYVTCVDGRIIASSGLGLS